MIMIVVIFKILVIVTGPFRARLIVEALDDTHCGLAPTLAYGFADFLPPRYQHDNLTGAVSRITRTIPAIMLLLLSKGRRRCFKMLPVDHHLAHTIRLLQLPHPFLLQLQVVQVEGFGSLGFRIVIIYLRTLLLML